MPNRPIERAQLEAIFDAATMGIVLHDLDFKFVRINKAMADIHGLPLSAYEGKTLEQLLPHIWEMVSPVLKKVLATGKPILNIEFQDEQAVKSGDFRVWMVDHFPVAQDGQIIGVGAIVRNITESRQAESAWRQTEQKLALHVQQTPLGVIEWDVNFRVRAWNPSAEKIFGFTAEEAIGKRGDELLVPPEYIHLVDATFADLLAQKGGTRSVNQNMTKDGRVLWCDWYNTPLIAASGEVLSVASMVQDITESRQAEQRLNDLVQKRTDQVRELERQHAESERHIATGRMAARIAHEINNPLAGIKNSFLLIKDAVQPPHPYFGYVKLIEDEIERIRQIVRRIYDGYRPEVEQPSQLDLMVALREVAILLSDASQTASTQVEISGPAELMVAISAASFRELMLNVLHNALDASPSNVPILIKVQLTGWNVHIDVIDQGPGVPAEIAHQIFEPFFTTKSERPRNGLGLGLSVSDSLAKSMGGSIALQPSEHGAHFRVVLPVCRG